MSTTKKPLTIGFRPGMTLFVDGAKLETSRRNSVTIRNYSSVRWVKSTGESLERQPNCPDDRVEGRPQEPRKNSAPW